MAEKTPKQIKIAGKDAYYVAIDGTDSIDSARFGVAIEAFGVQNLFAHYLASKPADPKETRLEDPNHPTMPIWRVAPVGKGTASATGVSVVDRDERSTSGTPEASLKHAV